MWRAVENMVVAFLKNLLKSYLCESGSKSMTFLKILKLGAYSPARKDLKIAGQYLSERVKMSFKL